MAVALVTAKMLVSSALVAGSTVTPNDASAFWSAGIAVVMLSAAGRTAPLCRKASSDAA